MGDGQDVGVDLDAGDLHAIAKGSRVLTRRGAAGEAEDRDALGSDLRLFGGAERIGDEHVVPRPAGEQAVGVVDGMDRLPLVEDQLRLGPIAHDLDIAVRGFLLVDQLPDLRRLDARGQKDPRQDHSDRE